MNTTAPIKCLHTEIWPIEKFIANPRNPNRHPESQLKLLAQVIVANGWRSAIVVSTLSNLVVKGHGRLAAAKHAGLTEAPVELQHYESAEAEMADLIADNRIAELSEMDEFMLASTLREIPADQSIRAGFTKEEFDALCANAPRPIETEADKADADNMPYFKFGKNNIPMTPAEVEGIESRAEAYREIEGTNFGFVRWLLKLKPQKT